MFSHQISFPSHVQLLGYRYKIGERLNLTKAWILPGKYDEYSGVPETCKCLQCKRQFIMMNDEI